MRFGCIAAALLFAWFGVARAQMYPTPRPVPRSTDAPTLHAQAVQREVTERFGIGLAAENRNEWDRAAPEFERIVALKPPEPQGSTAHYDLGLAYAHLGRNDDAAAQFRAAIALDPGFLAAMANLIGVDLARGNIKEARAVADGFLAIAPDSARALYSRGIVALAGDDARTAQNDFGRLIASNPSYAVAHYDLGLAEMQLGRSDDALREFQTALGLAPRYARARFALATLLLKTGRRADARVAFDEVARDPNGDSALANLAGSMRDAIAIH